jgi:hypothetical protein
VIVAVDGTEHNATASGSTMHFAVPSLAGGEIIHAKRDAGSGFWSPDVEVEAVIRLARAGRAVIRDKSAAADDHDGTGCYLKGADT